MKKSYPMRTYSRLARTEEFKNKRNAVLYVVLSIVLLLLLITYGLPAIAKMAAFLSDLRSSDQPVEQNDTTPPAPPRFDPLPEFTNRTTIEVKGFGEAGASVNIFANNLIENTIINNEGYFIYDFKLNADENTFSAQVIDSSGNKSQNSGEIKIVYDNTPPELTISTPDDNSSFYGSKQRQITIEGTTDAYNLKINERFITLEGEGNFVYSVTLQEGENGFDIVAEDKAGNTTTERISVHFWN